jgi:DNA (cytosine-5)-methyltransferase 1
MKAGGTDRPLTFIDVFAGAGGLSLGLMQAGWRGLFAVEREENAFATLKANLIDGDCGPKYDWPDWLPKTPWEIGRFVRKFRGELSSLRGTVDLLAGGPPCQGFSAAGRRRQEDPRNRLFKLYVEMARIIDPPFLVFENVPGIAVEFDKVERRRRNPRRIGRPAKPFSARIADQLAGLGYRVYTLLERASDFGVPQTRPRYLIVGIKKELASSIDAATLGERLAAERDELLISLRLPRDRPVTVREAISDLESLGKRRVQSVDSPRYEQVDYTGPRTTYQRLMHHGLAKSEAPNSMRLVKHRPATIQRFERVQATCRKGVRMTQRECTLFGMSGLTPMDPDAASHTLTSLPDDFLHYNEPRVLTVRESARIQSFPDWYQFQGKYTTGGKVRKHECPRYTQVANAVPPLLAEVIGRVVTGLYIAVAVEGGSVQDGYPQAIAV